MLIKKETEYATFGLMELARYGDKFMDVRVIAKREKISPQLLSKVFQKLNKAKLIESKVGPNGGFRLRKEPEHIRLLEIMEAVQQKNVIKCFAGAADYCKKPNCPFKKVTKEIENNLDNQLSKISLKSLINKY